MTKSKRIEKKAMKVAKEVEVKANLSAEELMAKAREDYAKKFPEPKLILAKTPVKQPKEKVEPEEIVDEIIEDLENDEDEIEIIEVPIIKGKKVISQNSAQAQKLIKKAAKVEEVPAPAKKKLADMTEKERKEYYINLSAKATAAKVAKAEAKLAAEGKTDLLEKVPETTLKVVKKATRTATPVAPLNPLGGRVIPEGATGRNLKTLLKEEKKAEKKGTKPASTRTKGTTPLSKMTIEELEAIKGTIADVQWNKYFKMAGGVSGIVTKKADKPVVKKEAEVAPVVAKKVARTSTPEVKEVKAAPKSISRLALNEFTLDELIAELKARGCKGTIKVCAEVEL